MNVVETHKLGKRFGKRWVLRNCDLSIPEGRIVALVGPNGAGKSTLLHMIVGLEAPSEGQCLVLGDCIPGQPRTLALTGFVAQDAPLYSHLSVRDTLRLAHHLSGSWDGPLSIGRLQELKIRLDQKVGKLSGGQQAQLALTIALARHPRLLVLDEPTARLDPVARHDLLGTLMEAAADDGFSVILSSHVVSELAQVADYLILVDDGGVRLVGEIDQLLLEHFMVTGPNNGWTLGERSVIISARLAQEYVTALVRIGKDWRPPPSCQLESVSLDQLIMAYLTESDLSRSGKVLASI